MPDYEELDARISLGYLPETALDQNEWLELQAWRESRQNLAQRLAPRQQNYLICVYLNGEQLLLTREQYQQMFGGS